MVTNRPPLRVPHAPNVASCPQFRVRVYGFDSWFAWRPGVVEAPAGYEKCVSTGHATGGTRSFIHVVVATVVLTLSV